MIRKYNFALLYLWGLNVKNIQEIYNKNTSIIIYTKYPNYAYMRIYIYSKQLNIDIINLNCMFGVWLSASTSSHVWLHYIRTRMFLNILFLLKKN